MVDVPSLRSRVGRPLRLVIEKLEKLSFFHIKIERFTTLIAQLRRYVELTERVGGQVRPTEENALSTSAVLAAERHIKALNLTAVARRAEHLRDDIDVNDEFRRAIVKFEALRRPGESESQELAHTNAIDGANPTKVQFERLGRL